MAKRFRTIFDSIRTTTEICARQFSFPALAMIVGTPLLHAFAFHWDPRFLVFFPFQLKG